MVTIKQISNFLVLAKTLHFAKAAHELGISQATLSGEIKKLETTLGFQLFDRSDKWAITLTEAGLSYFHHVKNIPGDVKLAKQEAGKCARGESGTLSIAVSSVAYDYVNLGNICRNMNMTYPDVRLRVFDLPLTVSRFDYLRNGKADVAFFACSDTMPPPEGYVFKRLISLPVMLALPRHSHWAKNPDLQISDLKNAPFVLPPREEAPNLRQALDDLFIKTCQQPPCATCEVIGYSGTLQFVAANMGVGIIFQQRVNLYPDKVVLKKLPVQIERSLMIGYREHNQSQVLKNFLQLLGKSKFSSDFA